MRVLDGATPAVDKEPFTIDRLPLEILIGIFEHLICEAKSSAKELRPIRLVCKAWTAVADATPSIWVNITVDEPEEVYLRSIIRSKDCPLHVVCQSAWPEDLISFVSAACKNAHRWSSVEFAMSASQTRQIEGIIRSLCKTSVPQLNELEVVLAPMEPRLCVDLFGGRAPALRHLVLAHLEIPWDSSLLCNLQTLRLKYDVGPSLWRIFTILTSCPQLVDLSLDYRPSSSKSDNRSTLTNTSHIHLASLRSIEMDLGTSTALRLVKSLRIPNCRCFLLSVESQVQTTTERANNPRHRTHVRQAIRIIRSRP